MSGSSELSLMAGTALVGGLAIGDVPWPGPAPVPGALTGRPHAQMLPLVDDGLKSAGLWSCTPGSFRSDHRGYVEFMHVVEGVADLRGDDGSTWRVTAGTVLVVPDGWTGTWVVHETVVKSYAIFRDLPRDPALIAADQAPLSMRRVLSARYSSVWSWRFCSLRPVSSSTRRIR